MSNNNLNLNGDLNTVLQNINARDISITIADDLQPKIKAKKQQLQKKILDLANQSDERLKKITKDNSFDKKNITKDIILTLRALRAGRCVLFIGPEIATDKNQNSLHDNFYQKLSDDDLNDLIYNKDEGFFEPNDDPMFDVDITEYYTDIFPKENILGNKILENLCSLPFQLSISLCPDNTMHDIYTKYDIPHEFIYFDGANIKDINSTKKQPVVLNVLGSASSNGGRFLFTYKDLYNYVKNAKIPAEIKKEIQDAVHFLFIGFDFNKWHKKLLMFVLGLNEIERKQARILIDKKTGSEIEEFLHNQFNINIVKQNYLEFTEILSNYAKTNKIGINLNEFLLKFQIQKLKQQADKVTDATTISELNLVEENILQITEKLK